VKLSEVAIERPVLATVLSLLIVLFGAVGLTQLSNRELPDVDAPIVSVTTVLPGAAAEVVESSVTQPLEDQLIGIEGVRHLTSTSRAEASTISVEFDLSRDLEEGANDVRDRVARARRRLPDEVEPPVVAKRDADASPIMWVALSGAGLDQIELTTLADTTLKDRLGKLPGVANVLIAGERRRAMRIWIDNRRLTSYQLTVADVAAALAAENVDIPSGRVESLDQEFTVRTLGELSTPEEFSALIIAEIETTLVRLGDVARVEVGPEDERKLVRFNGEPAVALGFVKQSQANTLDVADAVKAGLRELADELPPGVETQVAFDSSIFVRRSIEDLRDTIAQAVVLVLVVIFLFLRRLRATLIPAISIPISIIGTFGVLYFAGFTLNTLTLLGLTLAIGLVVDDAIVVLENVTRWIESGSPPREAARRGMKEISFAVVTATVSVVAVFLPLTFLQDTTGRLFREFGVTVAGAVAISGFVALTLSPALCARVLRGNEREGRLGLALESGFRRLADGYTGILGPTLRAPLLTVALGLGWFLAGLLLLQQMPREFVPSSDRGNMLVLTRAPEGSTIGYTARYQQQAEEIVLATPEIVKGFSIVALGIGTPGLVNEGAFFTTLAPWEERERTQQEIASTLRDELVRVPGIKAFPINPSPLVRRFGAGEVSLVIQGPDVRQLERYASEFVRRSREIRGLTNVRSDLLLNKPQLSVHIDRDRASDLGVSVRDAATTLQILLGGLDLSSFKHEGEIYDVVVQLEAGARSSPRDVLGLYANGVGGQLIPMASFVDVRESTAPRALPHFDRQRAATISGGLDEGFALGDVLADVRALADEIVPTGTGYRAAFSGESEDFFESSNALLFAYAMAVAIIFLVLAAQFESFVHPLTILTAVALSFTGALVALLAAGQTLNLFSQIGLVMLIGLVTKNAILIVEFANQLRDRGLSLVEAAGQAAATRFRPILMTAISTIVGVLPIALGLGAGGETRAPLGVAVVGGMFFSTALTIVVVPAAYVVVARAADALRARTGAGETPARGGART
jgi:multidrug efflux pump